MPKLGFKILGAKPVTFAASSELALSLCVTNESANEEIHSILLGAQVWIESPERNYTPDEKTRLSDLFGDAGRWGTTLRRLLWTTRSVIVPAFVSDITVDLTLSCPLDFEATTTKYLFALADGHIPITLQFSGSVFFRAADDVLQVAPIPWVSETKFRLPVDVYRKTIDHYYPNRATLSLRRDVFDRLYRYKRDAQIPTWEATLERLLPDEPARVRVVKEPV